MQRKSESEDYIFAECKIELKNNPNIIESHVYVFELIYLFKKWNNVCLYTYIRNLKV